MADKLENPHYILCAELHLQTACERSFCFKGASWNRVASEWALSCCSS